MATASSVVASGLVDVLDRPSSNARVASSAPMLRIVRCGNRLVSAGERGIVLLSDDDGRTWRQAKVSVSVTLTGLQFTSEQRGFAIGHGGVVLRTDDAGQTWTRMLDGRRISEILSSPDAKVQAVSDGTDKPWLALHFIDDLRGMIVGAFGLAFETSDGGQTWRSFAERLANPRALHLHAVHRRGDYVWIAGEQGLYAQSTNGGRQFSVLSTSYRGSFFALYPMDDGSTLLGGLRGTLILHKNANQFQTLPTASTQGVVQLLVLKSKELVLLDQAGKIFSANLPTLQFKPVQVLSDRTWLAITHASDGVLVGASFDGVSRLKTTVR